MRKLFFVLLLLFVSCKRQETEITTTDSTTRTVDIDSLKNSVPPSSVIRDTIVRIDTVITSEKGKQLFAVDEANEDGSFAKFRQQLLWAVESKNGPDLLAMLDTNIKLSFGGQGGIADFKSMWKPSDKNSPLWQKLGWVLAHGGSFRTDGGSKTFWAPYVYSQWPDNGPDAYEYGAIVGSSIAVYSKADAKSDVIARLDHHFVKVLDGGHLREKSPEFAKIQTPSGKTGYVRTTEIRSQLDYRAGFHKQNGAWKMAIFIAGD